MQVGYAILTEEHPPERIVAHAKLAEQAGFDYLTISDHFHPWRPVQGEAPFAWTVIGALSQVVDLPVVTQVTCPIHRYHPAIVAQAAATAARMCRGGLTLGLGTGELLNEHVVGGAWPSPARRLAMLDEAAGMISSLLGGEQVTEHGEFFTVDRAQLYTLPEVPPRLGVAASGPESAAVAARHGDLVSTGPNDDLVASYREQGGTGRALGQPTLCFDRDADRAADRLAQRWKHSAMDWSVNAELPTPAAFETATAHLTRDDVVSAEPLGDDVDAIRKSVATYADAGFDAVSLHNVGEDHDDFLQFARTDLLPALGEVASSVGDGGNTEGGDR